MTNLNRRTFLRGTVGALAVATWMTRRSGAAPALPKATEVRTLGKTGLKCSYLGIGTGTRGRGRGITDMTMKLTGEEFVGFLEYAYQQGITYFDMADQYGSHSFMREAMKRSVKREKVMLLSKVWARDPAEAKSDIERMRKELDTDCIDILLMHCLRTGEENWPQTLRSTMDVLSEAKAKGWIRAHGVSCHTLQALECAAEEAWTDVILARINPFGQRMDAPVETVVPILQKAANAGKGILGMKILGEGDPKVVEKMDESLKFIAELGSINAITIGFMNKRELDEVISRIEAMASA